jgi:uncharacterized protein (TIGR03118 family)
MKNWIRGVRQILRRPSSTRRPHHRRLLLEGLEERCLLSGNAYLQTNLVSDISGIARFTDPNLVNPWGIAYSPTSPFWISDNNAGVSTLYQGNGQPLSLVVQIPPPMGSPPGSAGTPTGIVFNGGGGFNVSENGKTGSSIFIWATEDGTIAGWNPGVDLTHAIIAVDNSANPTAANGAVYKGLAIGQDPDGRTLIYAANFRAGSIEVYDSNFHLTTVGGSFQDSNIPTGFAPFGIQAFGNNLFVTYAKQNAAKHDDVAGPGNGFVDQFNTNGVLLRRFASQGTLNSPWGLAIAPANFGAFSHDFLVGNFGDGRINAFNPVTGQFLGQLNDLLGNPITIGGLWGLKFGNGHAAGATNHLFFTAGIGDEQHGLFGMIQTRSSVLASPSGSATTVHTSSPTSFNITPNGIPAIFLQSGPGHEPMGGGIVNGMIPTPPSHPNPGTVPTAAVSLITKSDIATTGFHHPSPPGAVNGDMASVLADNLDVLSQAIGGLR